MDKLQAFGPIDRHYTRYEHNAKVAVMTPEEFIKKFDGHKEPEEPTAVSILGMTTTKLSVICISSQSLGKVRAIRASGKSLMFIDIIRNDVTLQVVIKGSRFNHSESNISDYVTFKNIARVGDWICELFKHLHPAYLMP